ncbi:rRNA biogenesis protein rrp36 [Coniosporium apollinis]|uniref:rRNA biogenesis protein RRP36 n=1 Tax=Coniosporium apollinis TaxID=61459 RepID=A0ABQ9NSL2_9PEZI|nr:rRNA biogenesis protein rrp36 [Coniosporium apollinis]
MLSKNLSRSLRAREDDSASEPYSDELDVSSPSVLNTGEGADIPSSEYESGQDGEEDVELSEDADNGGKVQDRLSKVSFGALAKAQDALANQDNGSRKRKRGAVGSEEQEAKLQALRERLQELKSKKNSGASKPSIKKTKPPIARKEDQSEEEKDSDASSASDSDTPKFKHSRSSKHAPAQQSSKRAVTRRRTVVPVHEHKARDPRFDPLAGPVSEDLFKKKYAFLNDYRASEMSELRASIKQTKNEADKEVLKRKLLSMESKAKADQAKEKQAEILREHRKKEKELVKQGKKPFYLKQSEQKKLALIDRFENMKGKQRDRVIERRRKKVASKERRSMPSERRNVAA